MIAKILVAEDDLENQRVICLRLSLMGASVTLARNGQEAVAHARAARDAGEPFHLVLMDMQMPVLDGYEATSTLRSEGFRTPVVAVTAFTTPEDRDECLAFGCDAHVRKPVDWPALRALLNRLLEGEGEDAEAG
ncbi:MAG: response regulator [Isosphaeraceae bacterium]